MRRSLRPSRVVPVLAFVGLFPGCHDSSLPLGSLLSSGDNFGMVLCIVAVVALSVWLIGLARN